MTEPIRILVLAANPLTTGELALEAEHRLLRNRMSDNREAGNCELLVQWAARFKDLKQSLTSYQPHVIHFAGHGTRESICLEDDDGNSSPVTKEQLAELLKASGEHLRLVVLNGCFSAVQAEAISQVVDYVVGTTAAVADDVAVRFAGHFYKALATGETVRDAHYKSQIELARDRQQQVAQYELLVRSGTDETRPLLPPMLPSTHKTTSEVEIKKARLRNPEFVNVSQDGRECSSPDRQGANEENTFAVRIEDLEVTHGSARFINKKVGR
ncbi:MAG TPA: CHAT domain-containing protein [Pyrinomonadaceae bacterium]|nr:CHAT domain-containing protein [Pyrinomonadaceae bacterium]